MTDNTLALTTGTELNHYQIESVLGQGGFGVVYKAHHTLLHETVVIKEFLPVELATRHGQTVVPHGHSKQALYQDCLQRFMAEGRTLVKLRHPNVVRCRDLFNANGTAYLVMDFEDGLPLDLLIKSLEQQGLRYSEQQLLHFLLPLCDGLDYIHQQGVLHRDIKPANVFIRRSDGSPVIIDFGAAKQNFAAASQSQAPYTEFYAPLEQIEGSGEAKPSVDVHAFGGLMYRVVTGQLGPRAEARAMALLTDKADPLISAVALAGEHYSRSLLETIDRCLAFLPHQRPASIAEVKRLLLNELVDESSLDSPPKADLNQLDELLELAGADGVITDSEMQMLLSKAKTLQLDTILAQQHIVQRCVQRGWQLASSASTPPNPKAKAGMDDIFADIFARHPHNPIQQNQHIVLDRERISLCIERNSPALKSHQLSESIGIETAGKVFTPLVQRGDSLRQAYTQVFSTAEDLQQAIEIHLMRTADSDFQHATSISKVTIALANPAAAGIPQIEIALYAHGNDLFLDVQRLDQVNSSVKAQSQNSTHGQDSKPPKPTQPKPQLIGVGGWLWLLVIALGSKIVFSAARIAAFYPEFSTQADSELELHWYQHDVISVVLLSVYVVLNISVLVMLFKHSRHFIKLYTATVIVMTFFDFGPIPLALQNIYQVTNSQLFSVLFYEVLLLSYVYFSRRVRNTFERK